MSNDNNASTTTNSDNDALRIWCRLFTLKLKVSRTNALHLIHLSVAARRFNQESKFRFTLRILALRGPKTNVSPNGEATLNPKALKPGTPKP